MQEINPVFAAFIGTRIHMFAHSAWRSSGLFLPRRNKQSHAAHFFGICSRCYDCRFHLVADYSGN